MGDNCPRDTHFSPYSVFSGPALILFVDKFVIVRNKEKQLKIKSFNLQLLEKLIQRVIHKAEKTELVR